MTVYLLEAGADAQKLAEVEQKLKPELPDLTRLGSIEDIEKRSALGAGRSFVLLVAPPIDDDHFAELLSVVARHRGKVFFIVIGGEITASHYKRLIQSGNADWVADSGAPREVLEIIARHGNRAPTEAAEARRPLVVSFVPSAGGVGNATLSIETAIQLNKRKGAKDGKACLIDLDFQTSHVCDYLDLEPHLMVEEITRAPERLDTQLLDIFASHHSSGLDVIAAPRSKFQARDLSVEALSALFDLIAQRYEYILIDLPVVRRPWTTPVLSASQAILIVGLNTIPGMRQISETLAAIRGEAGIAGQVRVVINRCQFGLLGGVARGDHVRRALGEESPLFVREAKIALDCVNAGTPMTLANPSDRAVKDVASIAGFCAALKPAAHK